MAQKFGPHGPTSPLTGRRSRSLRSSFMLGGDRWETPFLMSAEIPVTEDIQTSVRRLGMECTLPELCVQVQWERFSGLTVPHRFVIIPSFCEREETLAELSESISNHHTATVKYCLRGGSDLQSMIIVDGGSRLSGTSPPRCESRCGLMIAVDEWFA